MVLYYVNEAGVLTQTYTTNFRDWYSSAIVSSDGTSVYPANDSSLSAVWYKDSSCGDCSYNSLAVYQDRDALGFQLINSTKGGDTSHTSIDGNPTDGSGSVFDLQWRSPTLARLRLTYQLRSGQLATATYNGNSSLQRLSFLAISTLTTTSKAQPTNGRPTKHQTTPAPT